MDIKDLFVVISTILILIAPVPYFRDVIKRATKPKLVTWSNWTLLTLISATASLSDHQYSAAIMSYSLAFECLGVTILGWRAGSRKIDKLDIFCQIGILVSLILWWIFNSPAVAIVAVITIDMIALLPTWRHAWHKPGEETATSFLITSLGAGLALLAARHATITALASPIYIAVVDLITAFIIIRRRKVLKK